jgi:outer membrane protein OmpA-like peptidoglycan-associated protein
MPLSKNVMNGTGESSRAGDGNGSQQPDDLERIRRLLLAPEQKQLDELRQRLGVEAQSEAISQALPQAMRLSSARDSQLSKAITPAVESALKESVRRDPTVLTDAVFPIIGPAIRKAIAEAFEKMMQSLNQTMEHSLSVKGLKWRVEALRTGKSFAEVVLLRTLVYRVEQVFLIHKETGLLLQHAEAGDSVVSDTDMVSGMLTAIQDFVRDAFRMSQDDGLETFQLTGLNVWIESGPHTKLAAVIRGVAPRDYREIMQDAMQRIVLEQRAALEAFSGDATPFAAVRPILKECLRVQLAEPKTRRSPLLRLIPVLFLILAGCGWLGWKHISEHRAAEERRTADEQARVREEDAKRRAAEASLAAENARWTQCVDKIKAQEGIVVIEAARRDGRIYLSGLRDPLAAEPRQFVTAAGYDPGALVEHWEPYYALNPVFVLKRATARLRPPASVRLRLQGDTLVADGSAPASWIGESRSRAESIPGVAAYDASAVLDESGAELAAKKKEIEGTAIYFGEGIQLDAEQTSVARRLARQIVELQAAAARAGRRVGITVTGHTTDKGTELYNQKLGEQRAGQILGILATEGVQASLLAPVSVGPREQESPGATPEEDARNRRVTFRVAIDPANRNSSSQ